MERLFSKLLELLQGKVTTWLVSFKALFFLGIAFFPMTANSEYQAQGHFLEAAPRSGWVEFREWVKKEMVYPEELLQKGVEGSVVLGFIVKSDGSIEGLKTVSSPHQLLDQEAKRLFYKIIWWPAIDFDEQVESSRLLEIPFKIKKYNSWTKKRGYGQLPDPHSKSSSSNTIYETNDLDSAPHAIFANPNQTIAGFIQKHLTYPEEAYRRSLSGKVTLSFVIEPSGNVTNIYAVQPLGGGLTEEAIRLLKQIEWYPGVRNDEAVRGITTLDVVFVLPQ
jgi:protein TonB